MIRDQLKNMSLEQKVGQLFMCGFDDTKPNDAILSLINDYHIGGVNYFRRNASSPEQVATLSADLQQASGIPLLISIDQEGGMVAGIEKGVTLMPGNMAIGATRDIEAAHKAAFIAGRELRAMGINMDFAPCLDVNNNPDNPVIGVRSYGESPSLVATMGCAAIKGYQEAGVTATTKHFPGHGDTNADSHHELPLVGHDRKRLHEVELVPFKQAIASGVDAVMTAHVIFPAYEDQDIPATLSHKILTGLLRTELGFEGIITTDCLEMNAIQKGIGVGLGAVMAIEAGADLVLISHQISLQTEGIEAVLAAVRSGRISEARIEESVERLLKLKQKNGLFEQSEPANTSIIATDESLTFARSLSEASITLVKNEGTFPLKSDARTYIVWPNMRPVSETAEPEGQEVTLGKMLTSRVTGLKEQVIDVNPSEDEIANVLAESMDYEQVVVATYNASFSTGQQRLVQELAEREGIALIVASLRIPYDLTTFPKVKTYLACYENKPLTIQSLAKVLMGDIPARGKLPVTVGSYAAE
ncbi:beta-N-acetylhexosaminidase [Paenibacillus anaericanus]|uniref:beta-N-acetylhexosaminidase n=1 Tax=Paenibacillus anaericanus TaxID=170367 RepID=A0A3S1DL90_9BACL|nr:beta-N-acetylhexosaminidase [Paenibacillus anaericanus]RUT47166.1 beta-N-acetylhexosaminidase [Paenibacillus anaericanus]